MSTLNISSANTADSTSGTQYSLTCVNDSTSDWTFYMYQKMPNQPQEIFSLAWLASPYLIRPQDQITFTWSIDYSFVWSDTGNLQPGVTFNASGVRDADPAGDNLTTFSLTNGAPGLSTPIPGGTAGSLTIQEADDVPNGVFSTGIGMSGQGTFAQQALANTTQVYTPEPVYYVAAGTSVQMGQVLAETVTQTSEVTFEQSVYSMTATLGENNLWTIS